MTPTIQLVYLPGNAAWMFRFGDAPLRIGEEAMFFTTRIDAAYAASRHRLGVEADGTVYAFDRT